MGLLRRLSRRELTAFEALWLAISVSVIFTLLFGGVDTVRVVKRHSSRETVRVVTCGSRPECRQLLDEMLRTATLRQRRAFLQAARERLRRLERQQRRLKRRRLRQPVAPVVTRPPRARVPVGGGGTPQAQPQPQPRPPSGQRPSGSPGPAGPTGPQGPPGRPAPESPVDRLTKPVQPVVDQTLDTVCETVPLTQQLLCR